jgi:hypothetical protein
LLCSALLTLPVFIMGMIFPKLSNHVSFIQQMYQTDVISGLSVPNFLMWLFTTPVQVRAGLGQGGIDKLYEITLCISLFWERSFIQMGIKPYGTVQRIWMCLWHLEQVVRIYSSSLIAFIIYHFISNLSSPFLISVFIFSLPPLIYNESQRYFYSSFSLIFNIISAPTHTHEEEGAAMMTMTFFDTSASLITFILLGKYLEIVAKGRTSDAIRKLMSLQVSFLFLFFYTLLSLPLLSFYCLFRLFSPYDIVGMLCNRWAAI